MADDLQRSSALGQPGTAVRSFDLSCLKDASPPSPAYQEFFATRGFRYQISGVFCGSAGTSSILIAFRGDAEGPFPEPALALVRLLIPHLQQAAMLESELAALRSRLAGFSVYLDRCPYPFLLADGCGHVIYANAAANETTALRDGLAIATGRFSLMSPRDQNSLLKTLEDIAARRVTSIRRLDVKRLSGKPPFLLWLMPVPRSAAGPRGPAESTVSILIVDRGTTPELDLSLLRELFALTRVEARVTLRLAAGSSAETIAGETGTSLQTIRTHIRRILSKTATVRQGELVSVILRTVPFRAR
jgi:DNA-binding CsgD family transcriptional regulator